MMYNQGAIVFGPWFLVADNDQGTKTTKPIQVYQVQAGENMRDTAQFLASYRFEVRFADLDALGHVNHVTYLSYMETARLEYFRSLGTFREQISDLSMIVARCEIDYLAPVHYPDQVTVQLAVTRLGGKSFDMEYLLTVSSGQEVARGFTVMVAYDYASQRSITIPAELRGRIIAFEGLTE